MISIQSVSKAFRPAGGGPPNQVLQGVSFTVPKSCLYGLIGPGASGKSILLKMIVGLMKPDSGSIVVDGIDVTQASELELQKMRLKFGMLFQQDNPLVDCVNQALANIKSDGTLDQIEQKWLSQTVSVPVLQ